MVKQRTSSSLKALESSDGKQEKDRHENSEVAKKEEAFL
jgi:hypothetical protein